MNFFQFVFQDWRANKSSAKGRVIMLLFRIANFCATRRIYSYIGIPYRIFYKILVEWVFSIEIPWNARIGKGLCIYHGQGLVINTQVVIGNYVTLRHCTTIGNKQRADGSFTGSPIIGNYVDVGCNTCIIGDITIGDHATVGCGSVVTRSVPVHAVVAGNPAKQIKSSVQAVEVAKLLQPTNSITS